MEKDCGAWINLLSHKVKQRLNATLQNLGITGVQSRVIYYILVHCKDGPVFQRDIENAFGLSRSTATGILQLMERNGIIRKESVASDARLKSLVPTPHAAELDAQVRECLRANDRQLTRGLSEGQVQLFKEIAAKMSQNLDDWNCRPADCCAETAGHSAP
ncbi:MarR family winged helix-turn-helix transcriptional regulator [uncultured Gemmiger sp.]|uniref:MarR family winged helix-turn-helix transcriptional regulator n=1 Tax=uncultured Gemmiger sp. TaxID=1623490 RepID=UPI0025D72C07|nr:MarR family winged helix-turn-helix transcriptional regulator [uncultured Gemmiger sp.]